MGKTVTEPLTGKALLQKVKEFSSKPRREVARKCGYQTKTKSGSTRVNLAEFYQALLEAKGVNLDSETTSRRGREATYRVSVQSNGQILIGSTYTREMGLQPGDEFDLKLGYKHIHLIQRDGENHINGHEA